MPSKSKGTPAPRKPRKPAATTPAARVPSTPLQAFAKALVRALGKGWALAPSTQGEILCQYNGRTVCYLATTRGGFVARQHMHSMPPVHSAGRTVAQCAAAVKAWQAKRAKLLAANAR